MTETKRKSYSHNKFQVKNAELTQTISTLEDTISSKDKEILDLNGNITELNIKIEKFENDAKILQDLLNDSYTTVNSKDLQIQAYSEKNIQLECSNVELEKSLKEASTQIIDKQNKLDDAMNKYMSLKTRFQDMSSLYDSSITTISNLESKLSQKEDFSKSNCIEQNLMKSDISKLKNDVDKYHANIVSMKNTIDTKDEYIKLLLNKIGNLENLVRISNGGVPHTTLLAELKSKTNETKCDESYNKDVSRGLNACVDKCPSIQPQCNVQLTARNTIKMVRGLGRQRR